MGHVQIIGEAVIKPSEPTPTTVLALSLLDSQHFLRFTTELLFLYKPQSVPDLDRSTLTARFKSAMAKALVPYYPLAGRVRHNPEGNGLEVVCHAQGAVFIEAASDYAISDLEKVPASKYQWRELLKLHLPDEFEGGPNLVIQLTWLQDGSATFAIGHKHTMFDATGTGRFLNYLGRLLRLGLGANFEPKPTWDRHLLDSITSPGTMDPPAEFARVQDISGYFSRFLGDTFVPTSTIFDMNSLHELKKVALLTSPPGSTYTSFDVLSAHVWRSWALSLNLPPNQTVKLLFSINIRTKLKPPLPAGYYGNAFMVPCAQCTVKELAEKDLGHAAALVRRAKEQVNSDFVKMVVDLLREDKIAGDSTGALIMTHCTKVGFESFDFGMGRPINVSPLCPDRFCMLLPATPGSDGTERVKVMVAVPEAAFYNYDRLIRSSYVKELLPCSRL